MKRTLTLLQAAVDERDFVPSSVFFFLQERHAHTSTDTDTGEMLHIYFFWNKISKMEKENRHIESNM